MEWDDLSGCLGWYFGSAWMCAKSIYAPRHVYLFEDDDQVTWLYRIRGIAGVIIIAYAAGVSAAARTLIENMGWTVGFCLLSALPAGIVVILFAKPGSRRNVLAPLRYPAIAIGSYLAIILGMLIGGPRLLAFGDDMPDDAKHIMVGLIGGIIVLVFLIWFMIFFTCSNVMMATGMFRLGDAHPLLPPVIGSINAWAMTGKVLFTQGLGGGGSVIANLAFLLGGPASITVLSVVECVRLRNAYPNDFPFRTGPPHTGDG